MIEELYITKWIIPLWRILIIIVCILIIIFNVEASSVAGQETLIGVCGRDFVMLGADSFASSSISLTSKSRDKIRVLICPFPHKFFNNKLNIEQQQTILVSSAGDSGDCDQLVGILAAQASMREFEAGVGCDVDVVYNGPLGEYIPSSFSPSCVGLDAESVAFLARTHISSSLRSHRQLRVCLLVAGLVRSYGLKNIYQISDGDETSNMQLHSGTKSCLIPKLFWIDEYGSLQSVNYGAHGHGANFALSILDEGYHPSITQNEAEILIRRAFQQLRTRFVVNCPQHPNIKSVDVSGYRILN